MSLRVRFAEINTSLERNRERFNRAYFHERRCRLKTFKKKREKEKERERKTHRAAPSRPGEIAKQPR